MKKDSLLPKRCQRLRELRGKKTQKEMSAILDVTEKTYRSWEKGEYRKGLTEKTYPQPDLERLIKMSEIFHCSIDYLLCRSDCTSVDNHYISLKTGLSEDAINTLAAMKNFNKDYDQYRKPVELEALNFAMKDCETFREFIGYLSALFIGADKAFYLDKENKEWRFINDPIHVTYPTSKNANGKQTANTDIINIKSLAETDCIRHIELILENWKQEFKKMEM